MYHHQAEKKMPDILLLGKGLGNELHIAATLFRGNIPLADDLKMLIGGSGAMEISCAAGAVVYKELLQNNLLKDIIEIGKLIKNRMMNLKESFSFIMDVRGRDLRKQWNLNP